MEILPFLRGKFEESNNPNDSFDTAGSISLMKLVYEVKGEEPPSTGEPPSTEEPPSAEEPPSSEQPPSGDNKKDDTNSGNGSSTTNSSTDNLKTDNSKMTDSYNSTTNHYIKPFRRWQVLKINFQYSTKLCHS